MPILAKLGAEARRSLDDLEYRHLFEKIREGFFIGEIVRDAESKPVDFRFLDVNRAFTEQTGVRVEAAIGRRVSEVVPGFQRSIIERYGKVVDTGEPTNFEVQVPSLANRWYEARAHPLQDQRFIVIFLEITDRKQVETELEDSRALLSDIVESVDQIVWSARPDGYHDFFNRRWYEFTDAQPGTTEGDDWAKLFHPDDRQRTFERWRHSLATGEPYEIQYRLRHRSGEYRWVLGRAHPVRNETGSIIRWMGTCTDIHEQKIFAEKLEIASGELSHRIKNIFAVISGLIGLSVREHPEANAFADELRERLQALGRAHDYARPHRADTKPGNEQSTILGLVRQLLEPYQLEGRLRIVVEGEDAPLNSNASTPLSLAVHELATNAAKYGALSTAAGHVRVQGERSGGRYSLCWTERGGPPVREPTRFGFGSQLVEVSLQRQLRGELIRNWHPEGLEVCVSAPDERLVASD